MKIEKSILTTFALLTAVLGFGSTPVPTHPNVIIIITDDQGYGDLGITGNHHVKTPNIDSFARESIRFNQFYVSPVCSPTRSSLMTGRYSLRTGVSNTTGGSSIMATEEITIAEMLQQSGYKTGIFGKWHLGDNYPFRPTDQGFDESVIHLSGGMGQTGDFTNYFNQKKYFDPVLWQNGRQRSYKGYCSDIFTSEAIRFIENNSKTPFFCYLAFNAPHIPLEVPDEYYNMYKDIDPSSGFENDSRPFPEMNEKNKEDARKVYGMVSNIDDNVGKLLLKLRELDIKENTIVIFMTDNGPFGLRYNGGMRGSKSSVFRGGVRVPFFLRFPALLEGNREIETITAHIDILPSLTELCNAKMPADKVIDGKSFLPVLMGENDDYWNNRPLFFYWTRDYSEMYKNISLQKGNYKLIGSTDINSPIEDFELYDIKNDEFEQKNILIENKIIALELKAELDRLTRELINSAHLIKPQYIIVGSDQENPVYLNRNDMTNFPVPVRNDLSNGNRNNLITEEPCRGWRLSTREGRYNIKFKFADPIVAPGKLVLETNTILVLENKPNHEGIIEMNDVYLPAMDCNFISYYSTAGEKFFPFWVEIEKIEWPALKQLK